MAMCDFSTTSRTSQQETSPEEALTYSMSCGTYFPANPVTIPLIRKVTILFRPGRTMRSC